MEINMFGFKKKSQVTEIPTPVKEEPKITELKCIRCGATCVRTEFGDFRCKFCGAKFTDSDAEMLSSKRNDAKSEREAELEKEIAQRNAEAKIAEAKAAEAIALANARAAEAKALAEAKEAEARAAEARAQEARAAERLAAQAQERQTEVPVNESAPVTVEMSSEDIYSHNCNGVVEIITDYGRASGLIISNKGFALTNAHAVLDNNGNVSENVYVKHGSEVIRSQVIAIGNTDSNDPHNVDLALLKMERVPERAVSLTLGRSDTVRIGQHIYYIGNSKGEGLCMTAGIVSDNNRTVGARSFIMTDAATNPGNSGGPLFNDDGEVIGIHVSARNDAVGMKYAIPVNTARVFLNTVEDRLNIPRNTISDDLVNIPETSNESMTVGAVIALVLSGIAVLVKGLEFAKEIADIVE